MTLMTADDFWQFEHCSKIDVLNESAHLHLIISALKDKNTSVEQIDRQTYSLIGPDQAILIQVESPLLTLTLRLHQAVSALERFEERHQDRSPLLEQLGQPQT